MIRFVFFKVNDDGNLKDRLKRMAGREVRGCCSGKGEK